MEAWTNPEPAAGPRQYRLELTEPSTPVRWLRPTHDREIFKIAPVLRTILRELCLGLRSWPLYLWSQSPGTGKTSASLCLLDWTVPAQSSRNYSPEVADIASGFIDAAEWPRILNNADAKRYTWYNDGRGGTMDADDLWRLVKSLRLVVVDDLRRPRDIEVRYGEDHVGKMKRLGDLRVGRPLIVTSNLSPNEIAGVYDSRVADRFLCGEVVHLSGESRRGA